MKEKDIIQNLKSLKSVEPNEWFVFGLRATLLATEKRNPQKLRWLIRILSPVALTAVFVFIFLAAQVPEPAASPQLAGLNNEEILEEMVSSGEINIYLYEVSYFDDTDKQISLALQEVSKNHE